MSKLNPFSKGFDIATYEIFMGRAPQQASAGAKPKKKGRS